MPFKCWFYLSVSHVDCVSRVSSHCITCHKLIVYHVSAVTVSCVTSWLCITCQQSLYHVSQADYVSRVSSHYSYGLFEFHSCKAWLTPQYHTVFFYYDQKKWLEAECSEFSTVSQLQNVLILFLFEICIIYHKIINFRERFLKLFFHFCEI